MAYVILCVTADAHFDREPMGVGHRPSWGTPVLEVNKYLFPFQKVPDRVSDGFLLLCIDLCVCSWSRGWVEARGSSGVTGWLASECGHHRPASASMALGLQACAAMPDFFNMGSAESSLAVQTLHLSPVPSLCILRWGSHYVC